MTQYYDAESVRRFAKALLEAAGLDADKAEAVAYILVEGDLMGHTTHGTQLLANYLAQIESGKMTSLGQPETLSERPAAAAWDGGYLPGPWLVLRAMEKAAGMARSHGTGTVTIRRSHHIASLASYLKRATDMNMVAIIQSSDPAVASVAPYGGLVATHTPNPIAVGFPTAAGPVLMDVSTSITTNGMAGRLDGQKKRFDYPWLKDATGRPTDDPSVLTTEPKGSVMPIGGMDHGHKGFALGLMVEALSSGLAGHGRSQQPTQWGASVMVQMLDPEAFGGLETFESEMGYLVRACRDNPVPVGGAAVRVPGDRACALREKYSVNGVPLPEGVPEAMRDWGERLGVDFSMTS